MSGSRSGSRPPLQDLGDPVLGLPDLGDVLDGSDHPQWLPVRAHTHTLAVPSNTRSAPSGRVMRYSMLGRSWSSARRSAASASDRIRAASSVTSSADRHQSPPRTPLPSGRTAPRLRRSSAGSAPRCCEDPCANRGADAHAQQGTHKDDGSGISQAVDLSAKADHRARSPPPGERPCCLPPSPRQAERRC